MNELATKYSVEAAGWIPSEDERYRFAVWRRFDGAAVQTELYPTKLVSGLSGHVLDTRPDAVGSAIGRAPRPQVVVGLNPSIADDDDPDPTFTRCIKRARRMGAGGVIMINLYAYIATDSDDLATCKHPVGARCDELIFDAIQMAREVVVAWGSTIEQWPKKWQRGPAGRMYRARIASVELAAERAGLALHCLGTTKSGTPRHPLYLPDGAKLRRWEVPAWLNEQPRLVSVP